jgi:hypothetical protein
MSSSVISVMPCRTEQPEKNKGGACGEKQICYIKIKNNAEQKKNAEKQRHPITGNNIQQVYIAQTRRLTMRRRTKLKGGAGDG